MHPAAPARCCSQATPWRQIPLSAICLFPKNCPALTCLPHTGPECAEGMLSMEQDPPDIEPENERLETTTVNPVANLRAKVERLQRMGLLVQNVLGEVASFMERVGVSC